MYIKQGTSFGRKLLTGNEDLDPNALDGNQDPAATPPADPAASAEPPAPEPDPTPEPTPEPPPAPAPEPVPEPAAPTVTNDAPNTIVNVYVNPEEESLGDMVPEMAEASQVAEAGAAAQTELADGAAALEHFVDDLHAFKAMGGMNKQSARLADRHFEYLLNRMKMPRELLNNGSRVVLGPMPGVESFGGVGERLYYTNVGIEEGEKAEGGALTAIRNGIAVVIKKLIEFIQRFLTVAGRVKARLEGLAKAIGANGTIQGNIKLPNSHLIGRDASSASGIAKDVADMAVTAKYIYGSYADNVKNYFMEVGNMAVKAQGAVIENTGSTNPEGTAQASYNIRWTEIPAEAKQLLGGAQVVHFHGEQGPLKLEMPQQQQAGAEVEIPALDKTTALSVIRSALEAVAAVMASSNKVKEIQAALNVSLGKIDASMRKQAAARTERNGFTKLLREMGQPWLSIFTTFGSYTYRVVAVVGTYCERSLQKGKAAPAAAPAPAAQPAPAAA